MIRMLKLNLKDDGAYHLSNWGRRILRREELIVAIKEVVTKYCNCDLCEKEVNDEKELQNFTIPVKFLTEQTEGRGCKPYFIKQNFDLCRDCLEKITMVLGQGAQGYNHFWIKK
jgi:hypothetical protein